MHPKYSAIEVPTHLLSSLILGLPEALLPLLFSAFICQALPALEGQEPGRQPADPLLILLQDLQNQDPKIADAAWNELLARPKSTDPQLLRSLTQEEHPSQAGRLARLLAARGFLFTKLKEIPRCLQPEMERLTRDLLRAPTPNDFEVALQEHARQAGLAAPLLLQILKTTTEPLLERTRAACALLRAGHPTGLPLLVKTLENDQLAGLSSRFLLAAPQAAAQALADQGLQTSKPTLFLRSVELLGILNVDLKDCALPKLLAKGLRAPQPRMALASILALDNLRRAEVFPILLEALTQERINDRFQFHATAVGLALTAGPEQAKQLFRLLRSRNAALQETALVALGLRALLPGAARAEPELLQELQTRLQGGSSRLQKRAAEALGALAERGTLLPEEITATLAELARKGGLEVRYASALALAETTARGALLPETVAKTCSEVLHNDKLALASGCCREALYTVFEISRVGSSGWGPGDDSAKPDRERPASESREPAAGQGSTPHEKPSGNEVAAGEGPTAPYRTSFQWRDGNQPLTEARLPQPATRVEGGTATDSAAGTDGGSETGAQAAPSTPPLAPAGSAPAANPNPTPAPAAPPTPSAASSPSTPAPAAVTPAPATSGQGPAPESTPDPPTPTGTPQAPSPKGPESGPAKPKPTPRTHREEAGNAGGLGTKPAPIPCGLPSQRRYRLEQVPHPLQKNAVLLVGYLRTN